MALSKERRGEVAEAVLLHILSEQGFEIKPDITRRKLGNISKTTGISVEELQRFFRPIIQGFVDKAFPSA